jgi:DNA gyrase subunit A
VQNVGKVEQIAMVDEMQKSYLDYAMSVIVSRALPDVRDGLKPVQRRIIFAMHQQGLHHTSRYQKSAAVVGEVLKNYHPHGDAPVYEAMVRMAQNFSMRYMLVDGQGNFGSIDGDSPAAMRYTEARLAGISDELLRDINKETVDFIDNYSGTVQEPTLLPSVIPNLLLNGASGIAVGMATQIPPHNLSELCDALVYMIEHPVKEEVVRGDAKVGNDVARGDSEEGSLGEAAGSETTEDAPRDTEEAGPRVKGFSSEATVDDLVQFIKGPDFPTGASIYDQSEILAAYATGKGRIVMRAKAEIEEGTAGKMQIIVTELPYQVNKATLIARIADLVKEKKLEGIADLRDESDRKQMVRIVMDLKRDGRPQSILNNLYKHTAMQSVFNVNMVALVDGISPHLLTLKTILEEFVKHRQTVIRKRSEFELREARAREHILEGLKIAVDNIDEVIATIRGSKDADEAKGNLMKKFKLSELQSVAILDMQLRKLAALERQKIEDELKMVRETIDYLVDLLAHPEKILKVVKDELIKIKEKYGDDRKTRVYKQKVGEFNEEDLVANETTIVTITDGGYVKRQSPMSFRTQARGGKGVMGISTKETDAVSHIFYTQTHDNLLFFTDKGRVFQVKVWEIPETQRAAKGQAIVNLINIEGGDKVTAVLTTRQKNEAAQFMFMCTKEGTVKKTPLPEYANIRKNGLVAIKLDATDTLGWVTPTTGKDDLIIVSHKGQSIRFSESQVKPTHRDTSGVRGIKLSKEDEVVSLNLAGDDGELLIIMENGLGKKTKVSAWSKQGRGGQGVKAAQVTAKTGQIVTAELVDEKVDTLVLTSNKGQLIKMDLKEVPSLQRQTQGVILMRVKEGEKVAAATVVSSKDRPEQ